MTGPDDVPSTTSPTALQRRVLLAGVLTLALFLAGSYVVSAVGASQYWLLAVVALVYVLVTRPLMQPVREATRLRRRLAYQAFLDSRADSRADADPQQGDTP